MTSGPSHAGKLLGWERIVFGLVFALMGGFVVVVTLTAAHSQRGGLPPGTAVADSIPRPASNPGGRVQAAAVGPLGTGRAARAGGRASLDAKLARALRPEEHGDPGHLAVGVIDLGTGAEALYGARLKFAVAGIMKADLLAALLLRHQRVGAPLSEAEAQLAVPVIESSNNGPATGLWQMLGSGPAMATANRELGLSDTTSGPAAKWGRSRTTVTDQLRLLADLTAATSPLTAQSQDYELGLLANAEPRQPWGVAAAASPGTGCAVQGGWRPDQALWVVNSIGVVDHAGHRLLLAILSDHHATKAAGIASISAAARAAARVMTQAS